MLKDTKIWLLVDWPCRDTSSYSRSLLKHHCHHTLPRRLLIGCHFPCPMYPHAQGVIRVLCTPWLVLAPSRNHAFHCSFLPLFPWTMPSTVLSCPSFQEPCLPLFFLALLSRNRTFHCSFQTVVLNMTNDFSFLVWCCLWASLLQCSGLAWCQLFSPSCRDVHLYNTQYR